MDVVILIGLQGAGKSSFYRARFADTHVIISKDLMKNAKKKEARQRRLLRAALCSGRSVVIDNTNVTKASRASIIAIARECSARVIAYYFPITVETSLKRNRGPGRAIVPEVGIYRAARELEPPELAEGFDELHTIMPDVAETKTASALAQKPSWSREAGFAYRNLNTVLNFKLGPEE